MPELRKVEAWEQPASPEMVSTAISMVLAIWEPDADGDRVPTLRSLIRERGYGQAELAFAARELLYDEKVDRKRQFDNPITVADFERHIVRLKRLRSRLQQKLRLEAVNDLIADWPDLISWDDFGICDYTAANTPLYRFCYTGEVAERRPEPSIEDPPRPQRERTGDHDAQHIGSLLDLDPAG